MAAIVGVSKGRFCESQIGALSRHRPRRGSPVSCYACRVVMFRVSICSLVMCPDRSSTAPAARAAASCARRTRCMTSRRCSRSRSPLRRPLEHLSRRRRGRGAWRPGRSQDAPESPAKPGRFNPGSDGSGLEPSRRDSHGLLYLASPASMPLSTRNHPLLGRKAPASGYPVPATLSGHHRSGGRRVSDLNALHQLPI